MWLRCSVRRGGGRQHSDSANKPTPGRHLQSGQKYKQNYFRWIAKFGEPRKYLKAQTSYWQSDLKQRSLSVPRQEELQEQQQEA